MSVEIGLIPSPAMERLVIALVSVDGTMAACADHGDAATLCVLLSYYALVTDTVASASGRVVKVMGDGVLAAFPARWLRRPSPIAASSKGPRRRTGGPSTHGAAHALFWVPAQSSAAALVRRAWRSMISLATP